MLKYWTEKELRETLKQLTIIIDSREQVNDHITESFSRKKIPYENRKLDIGDYSCQLEENTFERSFVIERKHNLDELCVNLTADRDRFEREFLKAKAWGTKVFLLIENASWDDVYLGNYRSKLSNKSLVGSLLSWQAKYNCTILFSNQANSGNLIYGLLYYATRSELLGR